MLFKIINIILVLSIVNIFAIGVSDIDTEKFPELSIKLSDNRNYDKNDFEIFEDNQLVHPDSVTINCNNNSRSVVFVLDQSNSMRDEINGKSKWDWVVNAAKDFVDNLNLVNGYSEVALITFGSKSVIQSGFTGDENVFIDALDAADVIYSATNFNSPFLQKDANAIDLLKKRSPINNKFIVFLTDGDHESNEDIKKYEIINKLNAGNIKLFTISLLYSFNFDIQEIASSTDGNYFTVWDEVELNETYRDIANSFVMVRNCVLKWNTNLNCPGDTKKRNVRINYFTDNQTFYKSYIVPDDGIFKYSKDKTVYFFEPPDPGSNTEKTIPITPLNSELIIFNAEIVPNTDFELDFGNGYNQSFTEPITVKPNQIKEFKVRYTNSNIDKFRNAKLIIESEPCDITFDLIGGADDLKIINPIEGEEYSICNRINIKWEGNDNGERVNLSYYHNNNWFPIANNISGNSFSWNPPDIESKIMIKVELTNQSLSYDIVDNIYIGSPELSFDKNPYFIGESSENDYLVTDIEAQIINSSNFDDVLNNVFMLSKYFQLIEKQTDVNIPANDTTSVKLKIKFKPDAVGLFSKDMLFDFGCSGNKKLKIEAEGICDIPHENLVLFEDVLVNQTDKIIRKCILQNRNDFNITLKPFIMGEDLRFFRLSITKDSIKIAEAGDRITILPDSCLELTIEFKPDEERNYYAFIDYNLEPNYCESPLTQIAGNGIGVDAYINDINWNLKRVNGSYDTLLTIINDDYRDLTITDYRFSNETNIFRVDLPDNGLKIQEYDTSYIPVSFLPNQEILYNNELILFGDHDTLKSQLTGKGFLPQMETFYQCGPIVPYGDSSYSQYIIYNPAEYSDLTINHVIKNDDGEYELIGNFITETYLLPAGDSLIFDIIYTPKIDSLHSFGILISADNYDAAFNQKWKETYNDYLCGTIDFSYTDSLKFFNTLYCDKDIDSIKITNESNAGEIVIYNNYIKTGSLMQYLDIEMENDLIIPAGESSYIPVIFNSERPENDTLTARLTFNTSVNELFYVHISGNTKIITIEENFEVEKTIPGNKTNLTIKGNIPFLESSNSISAKSELSELSIKLKFNHTLLKYMPNSIESSIDNFIWNEPTDIEPGNLLIKGNGIIQTPYNGELFNLKFDLLLGNENTGTIYANLVNSCEEPIKTVKKFEYELCFADGRKLNTTIPYSMIASHQSGKIIIDSQIGFPANTRINLYNQAGRLISEIENDYLETGYYYYEINSRDYSSGVYYIQFISGIYSKTEKILIIK